MSLRPEPYLWREDTAPRAAVLVDMADYYAAARAAMAKAQRSIHLLNWAFESRTRLDPANEGERAPGGQIGDFLKSLAENGIDVRVLCWKTALPIAATQDWFPLQDRRSFAGTRVKFVLDDKHPYGACHHQKAIIIDDAVAFCGGADFGQDRWDTSEHLDDDPRRVRPRTAACFDSRHEVMAIVDGPPAAALGFMFRERWRRATGETLSAPPPLAPIPWPDRVRPEFTDAAVGLSRTFPAWRSWAEVRESEALTLASIAAARRRIYLENQYFTSPPVAEALALRLAEEDGPEVVLISTQHAPHWFDRMTMDRARGHFIRRLRRADRHGRFHIYSPVTLKGRIIIVHAKVAIIDDDFVRVGSSNMNNRSTGFDTECDLSLRLDSEANRAAAYALQARLVAHWLGCPRAVVEEAVTREGGLGRAIESLRAAGCARLRPIEPRLLGPIASFIAAFHLGDPIGRADSFRPLLRRRRLAAKVAAVARGIPPLPSDTPPTAS
ncbi:MAG: phospholipase D-like domain-containing protein [Caulobacteraceae bacterium]